MIRLLTSRALETIVRTPPTTPGGAETVRDIAGQIGAPQGFFADWAGSPDFSHNLVVSYARNAFTITAQGQYVSEGRMDLETPKTGPGEPGYNVNLVGSTSTPTVGSHFTTNLTGSYRFDANRLDNMELFLSINNLTDKDPNSRAAASAARIPSCIPLSAVAIAWDCAWGSSAAAPARGSSHHRRGEATAGRSLLPGVLPASSISFIERTSVRLSLGTA